MSDIAKTFDVLGWFSPSFITIKILLQWIRGLKIRWDAPLPFSIKDTWLQWRSELELLTEKHIPRYYYPKQAPIESVKLHGFSDVSEEASAGVVYLRMTDSATSTHLPGDIEDQGRTNQAFDYSTSGALQCSYSGTTAASCQTRALSSL